MLGSALALPAPTGWTLEFALDLFSYLVGNLQLFVEELEALGPLADAGVPALLAPPTRLGRRLSASRRAIVGAPLKLLGPEVGEAATVVFGKSLNAAVGPHAQRNR